MTALFPTNPSAALEDYVTHCWLNDWTVVPLNADRRPIQRWTHYRNSEPVTRPVSAADAESFADAVEALRRELGLPLDGVAQLRAQREHSVDPYDADCLDWAERGVWRSAHGVGLLTEFSRAVCVDVDLPYAEAWPHLSNLFKRDITEADTDAAIVRTRSGRLHLWFGVPDGAAVPTLAGARAEREGFPHVEIKGKGSCVPLPPSQSGDGTYEWGRRPADPLGSIANVLPPLPEWLGDLSHV